MNCITFRRLQRNAYASTSIWRNHSHFARNDNTITIKDMLSAGLFRWFFSFAAVFCFLFSVFCFLFAVLVCLFACLLVCLFACLLFSCSLVCLFACLFVLVICSCSFLPHVFALVVDRSPLTPPTPVELDACCCG